jgi:hypothetical protein
MGQNFRKSSGSFAPSKFYPKKKVRGKAKDKAKSFTDETGMGVIRIVNGALQEVLVDTGDIVVCLNLAGHVVAVQGEGAHVLLHLLHGLQGLKQLRALVYHLLLHRHRLPRRPGVGTGRHRTR